MTHGDGLDRSHEQLGSDQPAAARPGVPESSRTPVDLHVRWARLGDHDPASIDLLLTPAERGRAQRPSRTTRGRAFALGRALSRATVAELAGIDPLEVGFEDDDRGKPRIVRGQRRSPDGHTPSHWQHSVSHSGDLVVVAVARGAAVGVDVEVVDDSRPVWRLAERFFHPDEVARLASLPPELLPRAFYELWTRKEAVLKALGSGLSGRLDSVVPVLEPGADPAAGAPAAPSGLQDAGRPGPAGTVEGRRWRVRRDGDRFAGADLAMPGGHLGAVVVRGELGRVDVRRVSDPDDPGRWPAKENFARTDDFRR